jgi:hypothetical protein
MRKVTQISLIALVAIGIGALLIPGTSLAPAAFASSHHHSVSIHQHTGDQTNVCASSTCTNSAENEASVDTHHTHHSSVHIAQSTGDQSNTCDTSTCTNSAENSASVDTHHSSVHIAQSTGDQTNVCANSTCTNSAENSASVR